MQKWEYMFVVCVRNEEKAWRFRVINGNDVPNWFSGPSIYQSSNDVGEKGWELVSENLDVNQYNDVLAIRLVFKRPK